MSSAANGRAGLGASLGEPTGTSRNALEPKDWSEFSRTLQECGARIAALFAGIANEPAWREIPAEAVAKFRGPLPHQPEDLASVVEAVWNDIVPYPHSTPHPRNWGWVNGSALPVSVLGDFLASAMNPNCTQHNCAPAHVELQTLAWLKEMLGFDQRSSAVLVSGASSANLVALAVARHAGVGSDVRRDGIVGRGAFAFYLTRETHSSVQRAIEILGFGTSSIREVPITDAGTMDIAELEKAIALDRRGGRRPIAVVATAGTVNTGAIDPLDELADICVKEGLWLHVDGAFGALAWLDERQRKKLSGLQRADSLAFDAHKWLYQPYDIACVFVRDADLHRETFAVAPDYLALHTPVSDGPFVFSDHTIELSRRFRALKLWMSLRVHGLGAFAAAIARNIDQASLLAALVEQSPRLRLMAPVPLNVVCFGYVAGGALASSDDLSRDIVAALHRRGIAVPSLTLVDGRVAIRVAITNHRSTDDDFKDLVAAVLRIGLELEEAMTPATGTALQ